MMELSNCPFCGGNAELEGSVNEKGIMKYFVFCMECPCELGGDDGFCAEDLLPDYFFETQENAISAWNRRVTCI